MNLSFQYPLALYALLLIPALLAIPLVGMRAPWHIGARPPIFWAALALRALVLLTLILGLAGTQVVQAVNDTTVVFVVDHSDSVAPEERKRADDWIRASVASMKSNDRAAVVVFGQDALVERLASNEADLAPITSVPQTTRSNIAGALRLALALFPEETHKRVVLLSDGLENAGRAADLLDLFRARGVQIDVVPLHMPAGPTESFVDSLDAPSSVRKGQTFEINAVIQSTVAGPATVRLLGDGKLIETRNLNLQPGTNRATFSVKADTAGFRSYTAELQAANDTLQVNNSASAYTMVQGPPRVLVVSRENDGDNLVAALQSSSVETTRVAPAALAGDLATLSNYDAVFLVNVPAQEIPDAAMNALPAFVRDLGRGLVMIGGPDSFGAGGYLRTPVEKALPVDMDVRSRTQEPNLAIVFVIDKSGSMGRCHCDDPNALPGQYARIESGLSKVDIAKDAVMQAGRALGRADYVGVIAFDSNAEWALRVQQSANADLIQQKIGGIQAEGQTNIFAGLSEAEATLTKTPARLKHLILLTDGWSRSFEYGALSRQLQAEGITLSVVAAGSGSATYLDQLARGAGGRYYAARNMTEVPKLFFQETIQAQGSFIVEEPFLPVPAGATPILRGLDPAGLPALRGYNGTTPKATARVALVSDQGDPVLATWQYGLGRAVAWTSDAKGQWASEWVQWNKFNTFVTQLTNWVLPAETGLEATFASDGAETSLQVIANDSAGNPRNTDGLDARATIVAPNSESKSVALAPVGPGKYRGQLPSMPPGTYLVQVTQQDASGTPVAGATTGWVVPYSPEYKLIDPSASVLHNLVQGTGGQEIGEPVSAFAPFPRPAARSQPIWQSLLVLSALLFPLDVAARRLRVTRQDLRQFLVRARVARRHERASAPRVLETLFVARERAHTPRVKAKREDTAPVVENRDKPANQVKAESPPSTQPASPEAMTDRLKKAKERASKSRR